MTRFLPRLRMRLRLITAACCLGLTMPALAQPSPEAKTYRAGALVIETPWARATPGGAKVGGGYMRITNTGSQPDRLTGGTIAVAGRFELHQMSTADGIMRMRPIESGVVIAPGETVELKPGGMHAMFIELRQPLKEGDTVKGTLVFEKAGPVEIAYRVGSIGGQGAPSGEHHH